MGGAEGEECSLPGDLSVLATRPTQGQFLGPYHLHHSGLTSLLHKRCLALAKQPECPPAEDWLR